MQRVDGTLTFSPSDLQEFVDCEHLTRLQVRVSDGELTAPNRDDEELKLLRRKGIDHERAWLERLRSEGKSIVEIPERNDWTSAAEATEAAMRSGRITAQRRGEVCTMRCKDIDFENRWWTIPSESSKNADPHRVPLTATVLKIVERRATAKNVDDRYVFSNHRHTCVVARAKKAAAILCKGGVSFQFRAHDLRRTAAPDIGEAGVDRFHIAHVLNHRSVTHSTVTAIYDRYRYDKEKRAALEKWAEVLSGIVEVKPAPTTAPAKRTQRQNVYDFKPRALRRAGDQAREGVGCAPTQSA